MCCLEASACLLLHFSCLITLERNLHSETKREAENILRFRTRSGGGGGTAQERLPSPPRCDISVVVVEEKKGGGRGGEGMDIGRIYWPSCPFFARRRQSQHPALQLFLAPPSGEKEGREGAVPFKQPWGGGSAREGGRLSAFCIGRRRREKGKRAAADV